MELFYFSGTGNSLVVARTIANKLQANLTPIPLLVNKDLIKVDDNCIGIIFPSYLANLSGFPLILERFILKIKNIDNFNIFAICTCGGYEWVNASPSLIKLKHFIKSCNGKLLAGYSIRLPMNNLDYDHIPIPIIRDSQIIIERSKKKVDDICSRIVNKKNERYKLAKILLYHIMKPIFKLMWNSVTKTLKEKAKVPNDSHLQLKQLIPLTDKSIIVNEKCTGCGICAKICPVNNIIIVDHRPVFQHSCEMCFACDEWCPSNSIHHWGRKNGVKYHHPEVRISDFIIHSKDVKKNKKIK